MADFGLKNNKVSLAHEQFAPIMAKTALATESVNHQTTGCAAFPPACVMLSHAKKSPRSVCPTGGKAGELGPGNHGSRKNTCFLPDKAIPIFCALADKRNVTVHSRWDDPAKNQTLMMTLQMMMGIFTCSPVLMPAFTFAAVNDQPVANTGTAPAHQQTQPITKGQRVFTAGHSFHVWVAPLLDEIAKSAGISDHHIAGVSSIGGSTVLQHWNAQETSPACMALISGQVDVLTLSPIWLPDPGIENLARLGLQHNPDIRITVQEFWLPNDTYHPVYPLETNIVVDHNAATMPELRKQYELYFNDMDNYVRDLNKKLGKDAVLIHVPIGTEAVLALLAGKGCRRPGAVPEDAGGTVARRAGVIRPTLPIEILSAYCHFRRDLPPQPGGFADAQGIDEGALEGRRQYNPPRHAKTLNRLLQELAWDAVIHHPMSGVTANAVSTSTGK